MRLYSKPSMVQHPILQVKEKPTLRHCCSGTLYCNYTNYSSLMMLRHMSLNDHADRIEKAIFGTLAEGRHITGDLGGKASTSEYTKAIVSRLK